MYKRVKEPAFFGRKPQIVTAMFCDGEGCGKRIRYSSASDGRHLCEKCYKKLRGLTDVSKAD